MEERQEVAENIARRILATQLRVIREQRKLTPGQLAKKAKVDVFVIQQCEDPNADIGKLDLLVLQKIAFALDLRLNVSFETFGTLPEELKGLLAPERLQRPTFEQEFGVRPSKRKKKKEDKKKKK